MMKIRSGFVSNSSSASFAIPSFLLTEEQKELLLSIDDSKEEKRIIAEKFEDPYWENSKNNYTPSKKYHEILNRMIKKGEFGDGWSTGENKDMQLVRGGTLMDNGCLKTLMEKIDIDLSMVEFNDEWHTILAQHPLSVKHFAFLVNKEIEEFRLKSKEDKEIEINAGIAPPLINPYELKDAEFKDNGYGDLVYEDPYARHEFIRKKNNEN